MRASNNSVLSPSLVPAPAGVGAVPPTTQAPAVTPTAPADVAPTTPPPSSTDPDARLLQKPVVPVPSPEDRHILSRFSGGITPDLVGQAAALGGAAAWFEQQLNPQSIPDPDGLRVIEWWPHLAWTAERKWKADLTAEKLAINQDNDFLQWTLVHRMVTTRQLEEVMADFWSNLFYISMPEKKTFAHRVAYDAMIRAKSLGTFTELLKAAILHPGMLCYLDNARSTKKAPNENLGRELLELHTVGRPAGYDEDDVRNSTRALTGYRVEQSGRCLPYYAPIDHELGTVKVLDFEHPNNDADGRAMVDAYLTYLATHPSTARRVCQRLAVRFVADEPSDQLVDELTAVFVDSGTDIKTTLRFLVNHAEFKSSAGLKARTPIEDLTNTFRTLQIKVDKPLTKDDAANFMAFYCSVMGQKPFSWPRPDGFPDVAERWTSASRMLGSWRIHQKASNGFSEGDGALGKPHDYWLPHLPALFSTIVDRMSRLILAAPATPLMMEAASVAVDVHPDKIVTETHYLIKLRIPVLFQCLLDSPDHMTR